MMSKLQYLLLKIAEEGNEAGKEAMKAAQFGLSTIEPGKTLTNAQRICAELDDLQAVVEMLEEESDFEYVPNPVAIAAKKTQVEQFLSYSRDKYGMVEAVIPIVPVSMTTQKFKLDGCTHLGIRDIRTYLDAAFVRENGSKKVSVAVVGLANRAGIRLAQNEAWIVQQKNDEPPGTVIVEVHLLAASAIASKASMTVQLEWSADSLILDTRGDVWAGYEITLSFATVDSFPSNQGA
ncbi:hypothetical protein [Paraburkholderia sp. BCC1886]|uniref:hypothetical protein n=1 Tax=Paraburkholderia sp. BCC1886 TaxID=2562670 RepID=UPI001642E8EB|nr:hypothetical protein [Paraburkholderia sp. BCC1886]